MIDGTEANTTIFSKSNMGNNCLERFNQREAIIDKLRLNNNLSDEDLTLIANEYPDILLNALKPEPRAVIAYIKAGKPINRDTFPQSVWEDKDVLYHAFCCRRHLPGKAIKYVDDSIYARFVEEHSDLELAAFIQKHRRLLERKNSFFRKKEIQDRIKNGNEQLLAKRNSSVSKEESFSPNRSLPQQQNHIFKEDVILTGDLDVIKEELPAPCKSKINLQEYNTAVYPRVFHYISDLHLTHKVRSEIEKGNPLNSAVKKVVRKAVYDICTSFQEVSDNLRNPYEPQVLLIGGDISFDINIVDLFFEELSDFEMISVKNVYYVLGNHELWDGDPNRETNHDYEVVLEKYRSMAERHGITLLENQVAAIRQDIWGQERYILDAETVMDPSNKETIEQLFSKSHYLIFGGTGFSGCNNEFNAEKGIYRNVLTSREEEKKRSKECEKIFKQVHLFAKSKPVICLTHMPKGDWSEDKWDSNSIYVNGHTHKNYYHNDSVSKVFADNQIGYSSNTFLTKQFSIDSGYDIFNDYPDGIHEIQRIDYSEFGRGVGLDLAFRHDPSSELYLLKRDGIYMFVSQSRQGLSILAGGMRKKLKENSLEYYYSNLPQCATLLQESFEGYINYIEMISEEIKSLGGLGRIHGCIVDVDFFHHVYVNPYDGKVSFYYAKNMMERDVFNDLPAMLESRSMDPDLSKKMKSHYFKQMGKNELLVFKKDVDAASSEQMQGTFIYQPSREMKKVQKFFRYRILQIWPE